MNDKNNNSTVKLAPPIDLETANEIIKTYRAIQECTVRNFPKVPPGLSKPDLDTFNKDITEYNAFIFNKNEILEMIKDGATHLMVVLGAHPKVNSRFPKFGKGSFTVVVAGCTSITPTPGNREEYTAVERASEYPPRTVVSQLKQTKNKEAGAIEKLVFQVKE